MSFPTSDVTWFASVAQIATSIVAVISAIAAAGFFWKRREYAPRVQFDLGMRLIGERQHELLIELTATIRNVGLVRHQMRSFTFSVQGISVNDSWNEDPERNQQISFPHKIISRRSWIPDTWIRDRGTFVEPGVTQVYTYNIRISSDYEHLLLYAYMCYDQSKDDQVSIVVAKSQSNDDQVAIITKSVAELHSAYLHAIKEPIDGTKGAQRPVPDHKKTLSSIT
jgi:hypothetical protein